MYLELTTKFIKPKIFYEIGNCHIPMYHPQTCLAYLNGKNMFINKSILCLDKVDWLIGSFKCMTQGKAKIVLMGVVRVQLAKNIIKVQIKQVQI